MAGAVAVALVVGLVAPAEAAAGARAPGTWPAGTATVRAAVISGTPVPEGSYPFLALLLVQVTGGRAEYCGGSLIAEQWVLTAAHCVTGAAPPKPDAVLIGRMNSADRTVGDDNGAAQVFVNPAYNPETVENDTALIRLTEPSPEAEIRVVDESQDALAAPGAQGTVIGAGETRPDDPNSQPATVEMGPQTVLADSVCTQAYGAKYLPSSMLCGGGQGTVSPCFGDSGGPLFVPGPTGPVLLGVVSHGPAQCGSAPGVYSRVSAERTWIRDTMATLPSPVIRLAGGDRTATAIAVSGHSFATPLSAKAVVLASGTGFADALAGTPLAVAKGAPLLLTDGDTLDPRVAAEIGRVLRPGQPIYLLGGLTALSAAVQTQLTADGYAITRYGGTNRFATAVMIASAGLGDPATVLEATGLGFADGLAGGAAAAQAHGAVLLTIDRVQAPETAAYLTAHPTDTRYALGGPAAAADPGAHPLVGTDRYDTSVQVAKAFFPAPSAVGAADGLAFPDALSGGAQIASLSGPMLLVPPTPPGSPSVLAYFTTRTAPATAAFVYGGPNAVAPGMVGELVQLTS
jgi:secreted trypsin-like serine protease